jgi:hypothetical protein
VWFPAIVPAVGRVVQDKFAWEALGETRVSATLDRRYLSRIETGEIHPILQSYHLSRTTSVHENS